MSLPTRLRRFQEPRWRRRFITLSDQGASSLSNMLVFVLVARSFDAAGPAGVEEAVRAVGAFSAAMIAYQLTLGATKALIGQTYLSLYSHVDADERVRLRPFLTWSTFWLAVLGSVLLWAIANVVGGLVGSSFVALALMLPVVLVHDTWRFALVVDRPGVPLVMDLIWLGTVLAAFLLVPADAGVPWFIYVWGGGAGLGILVGWAVVRVRLQPTSPSWWFLEHREMGLRYLGEFFAAQGASRIVAGSMGGLLGVAALGTIRTSEVFYGPHNTLHAGMYLAVVPEGAQTRDDPVRLRAMLFKTALGLAGMAGLWMVVGLLLPDAMGAEAFGAAWAEARPLLVPMGIAMVAAGVGSGGVLGLRSLGDAERSLRARLFATPWSILCPLVGALTGGVVGFAFGFALGKAVGALIWWGAFHAALGDRTAELGEGTSEEAQSLAGHGSSAAS